ncbi:hypothetical protein [Nitrobacter sp.]|uniref:hypothetical protein n=1 Tax=Nitrobacter sp. TaxID=29420 RepID=UPI0029CAC414|nr:hypothetical protein [Nitrobacter sp.]
MRGADMMDPREQQEMMRAFAKPESAGNLVPQDGFNAMGAGVSIQDGIITARKVEVERDDAKVLQRIAARAAIAGDDWFYRFPVKNRKTGQQDWIEGPSIKCANSVARLYGNCQVDTRVQDAGTCWIIYARFVDYETGFSYTRPFQQDKNAAKLGGGDDARKRDIALQIGVSKAIRNVVCNALEDFTTYAFEEAQKNLVGRVGAKLDTYKEKVKERLAALQVDIKRVELVYGRTVDAWLAPQVAGIIAELKAISDGMATIDETWPPLPPPAPKRSDFDPKAEAGKPTAEANASEKPAMAASEDTKGTAADAIDPEVKGEPTPDIEGAPTTVKNWAVTGVVGQDLKLKAIFELLDDLTETPEDVAALEATHSEFIGKLGSNKRAELNRRFSDRKIILAKKADR